MHSFTFNAYTRSAATDMNMNASPSSFLAVSFAFVISLVLPVYGQPQPTTTCTPAMLSGFTPCMNFLNGNTRNVITPTPDCCTSVKTLAVNGSDCLCQLISGRSPFQFQVNRTLALSLPRACNTPNIPVQCDVASVPIPAPGSGAFAPVIAPTAAPPPALESEPDKPSVISPTSSKPAGSAATPSSTSFSSLTHLLLVIVAFLMYL